MQLTDELSRLQSDLSLDVTKKLEQVISPILNKLEYYNFFIEFKDDWLSTSFTIHKDWPKEAMDVYNKNLSKGPKEDKDIKNLNEALEKNYLLLLAAYAPYDRVEFYKGMLKAYKRDSKNDLILKWMVT